VSSVDLVIRNARVVTHIGEFDGGVAVKDGVIAAVGANDSLPKGKREIDAEGRYLMPGVIDPHTHLGVNYGYDVDMDAETAGAASGGITTVLLYIRNTEGSYIPFYKDRSARGEAVSHIDFGFHFGIQTEEHIHELPQVIAETGVVSYKLYFGYEPGNPIGIIPATDGWVYAAMRELAKHKGGIVSVHCENTAIASWLKNEFQATGRQDLPAYTESRPPFTEIETAKRMMYLSEITGCPLYIVHTSASGTCDVAEQERGRGVDVTVETCPHYLVRTAWDEDLTMAAKVTPPLRDAEERDGLWKAIFDGKVRSIGSDHVVFLPKEGKDLWKEKSGFVSFPWELALMLDEGVNKRGLPMSRLVELTSYYPSRRFGLLNKGTLTPGADADLVMVDIDEERVVKHEGLGTSIYDGLKLKGWPVMTVSRGRVVYENGQVDPDAKGHGKVVKAWQ
jgi:dihydroorotase-like cyclic amidohydrolase